MSEGALSPGDLLPDVTLWTLGGSQVKLKKTGIQVVSKSWNHHLGCSKILNFGGDSGKFLLLTTFSKLSPDLEQAGSQPQLGGGCLHSCLY